MARLFSLVGILLLSVTASTWAWVAHGPSHAAQRTGASACQSQLLPSPDVPVYPPDLIDGAKHPELIPDAIAYGLFFLTVAEPAQAVGRQSARQRAFLRTAGLREDNLQPAAAVLAAFKSQYDDLVAQYDASVQVANATGSSPDLEAFVAQLNGLVESTKEELEAAVGPEVAKRFEAHVQSEKRNMRIAKEAR